ncbi:hypothetical protein [Actinomadura sp. B10D3]|uniref:hypothetical protein n=1 Tax=Actinomadura sp. B10D3 TaxID=3153557 RepID=UPI00325F1B4B
MRSHARTRSAGSFTFEEAAAANYTGRLFEGTYTWSGQLWPQDGFYRFDGYLSHKPSGAAYGITCFFNLAADGYYTWGSALDPHF